MKKILIINGSEKRNHSEGKLNAKFVDIATSLLSPHYELIQTNISSGYNIEKEQDKFLACDYIIFQHPMFWFGIPSTFKKYIDDVYEYGKFFEHSDEYGFGGKLCGRQYMISATLNAPEEAFDNDKSYIFKGKNVDDVMIGMHASQRYIGLEMLPTFVAHNIFKIDLGKSFSEFEEHLKRIFFKK